MKKYIDLSPLYMDMSKNIDEEQVKIKDRWFERERNSGYFTEEFIKDSEQDTINNSIKNIKKILEDRE